MTKMLSGLKLINLPPSYELNETACSLGNVFVLKTCQRTLVIGFNQGPIQVLPHQQLAPEAKVISGLEAYRFLLETICGLKSRIVGENEIVHQFKEAYQNFCAGRRPNSHVQSLLEKLFKDAKEIRCSYLLELGLLTYAGIVRKMVGESGQKKILILGSGRLAEDIIKICSRKYDITLCARNSARVSELQSNYSIQTLAWDERELASKVPFIVNTIGIEEPFLDRSFSESWQACHGRAAQLIDLGEPSPFSKWQPQSAQMKNSIMLLEDIFKKAESLDSKREDKIQKARSAITDAALKRQKTFTFNLPFGWDELQFA